MAMKLIRVEELRKFAKSRVRQLTAFFAGRKDIIKNIEAVCRRVANAGRDVDSDLTSRKCATRAIQGCPGLGKLGGQQHPVKRLFLSYDRSALIRRGNQVHLLASDCQPPPAHPVLVRAAVSRNFDDPAFRRLDQDDMVLAVLRSPVGPRVAAPACWPAP